MTQRRTVVDYLHDIADAADKAAEFTAGMSFDDFMADPKTAFATIRALEIIGEAPSVYRRIFAPGIPAFPGVKWPACAISSCMTTLA